MSVFQYPIREYLREAALICIILATSSTVARNLLDISPVYDSSIHISLMIFGMRFLMKIRTYRATRMVAVGTVGLLAMQALSVMMYTKTGVVDPKVLDDPHSWWTRSLQMTSEAFMFTIAYTVVTFDLGITKYVRPPHDFYVREMTKEKRTTIIVSASLLIVITYVVYVYFAKLDIIATFFLTNILFLIVIIFTYRRDEE
jgi:hypothetical protein